MNDPAIVTVLEGWKVTSTSSDYSPTSTSSKWNMITKQMNDVMISGKQNKDTAAATRKVLSESTKTLKKHLKTCESTYSNTNNSNSNSKPIDELAIQCKSTIKSYQEEIDILTKRCKLYEQSYQTILNDLPPDPTIVLHTLVVYNEQNQTTIQQLTNQLQQIQFDNSKLEQENKKLSTELQNTTKKLNSNTTKASSSLTKEEYDELYKLRKEVIEYDNEIRNLKNQDVTVRKLEAKIEELQTVGAIAIDNAIQNVKIELEENEGKKLVVAYEQQEQLQQTIQSLQIQLQCEIQSKINTQNTMLDTNESIKLLEATWDTQKQILIDDNYRLNNELQLSIKQRDIYYNQLLQINNNNNNININNKEGTSNDISTDTTATTATTTTVVQAQAPGSGIGFTLPLVNTLLVSSPSVSTGSNINNSNNNMYNTNSAMKNELLLERQAYDAEVTELSEMNRILRDEIHNKDESIQQLQQQYDIKLKTIENEKNTLQNTIQTLQQQLLVAPNQSIVDTMKRELRILKRLEYNVHPDGQDDPEMTSIHYNTSSNTNTNTNTTTVSTGTMNNSSSNIDVTTNNTTDSTTGTNNTNTNTTTTNDNNDDLESILVAKLRRLESDLVTERTIKNELRQQIIQLQLQIDTIQQEKNNTDQLVVSLEKDLETAIASQTSTSTSTSTCTNSNSIDPLQIGNPQALQNILDPSDTSSSAPVSVDPAFDTTGSMLKPSNNAPTSTDNSTNTANEQQQQQQQQHSVASIIIAQRDRLKSRCDMLEAERDSFKRELQNQVQTTESLKSDNTKLYEKVRYLQNFSSTSSSSSNNNKNNRKNRSFGYQQRNDNNNNDLDLEALEQRYEASVDPFKQFNKLERQRKLNEMNSIERTVYIVARTVLSTKEMRSGLFVYVVTLHFLVFITTYHWSHSNDDNNCNFHYMNMEKLAHLPPSLQGPIPTTSTATTNKGV